MTLAERPAWQQELEERFSCGHAEERFCVKVASNGVRHYRLQCVRCGAGRPASKTDRRASPTVEPFDDSIQSAWWQKKQQAWRSYREQSQHEERQAWFDSANEYYASEKWAAKRYLVLMRDRWKCTARLPICTDLATQVHHLSYDHFGNEPLFELRSICEECHREITRMDRQRRAQK